MTAYTRGLHELGDGLFAYLQPHGGWGWSNAGLVTADDTSLLVDTLFDLKLTREMLDAMRPVTGTRPIDAVVNTHGNGDHCYGNQLAPETARIYAASRAVEDMKEAPPSLLATIMQADLGPELGPYMQRLFGPFRFDDIEFREPDETFDGALELRVGERAVRVVELGPAHTLGDSVVHVPDAGVVFTGDLLFVGGTPIMWRGPTSNWLDACDRLLAIDARVYVAGHGPLTDAAGVRAVQRYLRFVREEAARRHAAGMPAEEAALDIELGEFADWSDPERIAVNVDSVYHELDPAHAQLSAAEAFIRMAAWDRRR